MSGVKVEKRPLPDFPGHVGYQVVGETAAEVQAAITEIMNRPGLVQAEFRNPVRIDSGKYQSNGYVFPESSDEQSTE